MKSPASLRFLLPALALCLAFALIACQEVGSDSNGQQATSGDTEELIRQYLAAYNEHNLDTIQKLWTDSLVYNGERIGPEEFEALHKSYWGAFPDINAEITHVVSEGEQVAVRLMFEGTGEGEYLGHDVDGKNFRVSEIAIFHVSDGKLDEYWFQFDELGLWSQLGVLERPYPEE